MEPLPTPAWVPPWDDVAAHVARIETDPLSLSLLASTTAATGILSATRVDHDLRVAYVKDGGSVPLGAVAVVAGYVVPVIVPVTLYGAAFTSRARPPVSRVLFVHAAATAQAAAATFVATIALKALTGRPYPLHGLSRDAPDRLDHPDFAREWHPLEPAKGLAWPSGHTAVTMATVSALAATTRDPRVIVIGYSVTGIVIAGLLLGDHHWTSDVLAGAALGQSIGSTVGAGFRDRYFGPSATHDDVTGRARFVLYPVAGGAALGTMGVW